MDYEQKYKDAVKYLKAFLNGDCVTDSDILADFPELEDSEDEKIRKFIVKLVEEAYEDEFLWDFSKKDVLGWLEKHKEKK